MTDFQAVILDMDGTLIDSNDAHTRAWVEVLKRFGHEVSYEQVRSLIGMGSDKLLPKVSGIEASSEVGKQINTQRKMLFKSKYLPQIKAFPQVRALVEHMKAQGLTVVIGTSSEKEMLGSTLKIAEIGDLIDGATTGSDAKESKPDPDIVSAAVKQTGQPAQRVVMIGDTPYDVEAARRAGVAVIGVRCGGWNDEGLEGAIAVYDAPADLLAHYDESPLGGAVRA